MKGLFDLIYMVVSWMVLVLIRLPLILIGLVVTPIALRDRKISMKGAQKFTQFHKDDIWFHIGLPKWAWLWSNDRDGAMGDKRGWWHNEVNRKSQNMWPMYKWLALRNPVNNLGFLPFFSCDISKAKVEVIAGHEAPDYKDMPKGLQILKANDGKFNYYHLYYTSDRFYIRIGHKIKLVHNLYVHSETDPTKSLKSFTFRIRKYDGENG